MKINSKAFLAGVLAVALIGGVLIYNKTQTQNYMELQKQMSSAKNNAEKQVQKAGKVKLATVTVIKVVPHDYPLTIEGYGEVTAHYSLSLTSEVTGKIIEISPYLDSGKQVKKGDILARIEDSAYQKALASAKASLASAETDLLEERRQGAQAKQEWARSGLKGKPSALVLRTPQLKEAISNLEYQKKAVESAQYDLEQTNIRAPFNGIITSRNIELGSVIQSSTEIAQIESSDYVEARILLSENKWKGLSVYSNAKLAHTPTTWSAVLSNDQGFWNAYVARTERHIETDSRQRALIIQLKQPFSYQTPLYPGSFVTANIRGKTLKNVWKLPVSALQQGRYVWSVNKKSQLQKQSVEILFEQGDYLYITPFSQNNVQIVLKPLNYFKENSKVIVKVEGADHD